MIGLYVPDLTLPQFYLGTHRPRWLWDEVTPVPLMVSDRTLREVRHLRPATVAEWALDSGGFTELTKFGRWTVTPREYVERVARYDREIGRLAWAAPMDHMCEPGIRLGGRVGMVTAPGTGLTVRQHQDLTIANYHELCGLWPEYSDEECPFIPSVQADKPGEYEDCYHLYQAAGVDLGAVPLVGIGSVCRRQSTAEIRDIVSVVGAMPLVSHWFGMKLAGIRLAGVRCGEVLEDGDWVENGPASLDSLAWSYDARRSARLPGCEHGGRSCAGCPVWALRWRDKAITALREARSGAGLPIPA
jgi:hypothetical protein